MAIVTTFTTRELKSRLMRPATTSHFQCTFRPRQTVIDFINARGEAGAGINYDNINVQELINISCTDASLPGSSFQTGTLADSYTGVNETYAYRRAYDNRADFTFTVDNGLNVTNDNERNQNYNVLLLFENWMAYIADERIGPRPIPDSQNSGTTSPEKIEDEYNYFYRFNYPDNYMADALKITKFEKDYPAFTRGLEYTFFRAFPISIASIPVSYQSSQLLKCTVSFSYQRYIVKRV